jgi:hypothetical protein
MDARPPVLPVVMSRWGIGLEGTAGLVTDHLDRATHAMDARPPVLPVVMSRWGIGLEGTAGLVLAAPCRVAHKQKLSRFHARFSKPDRRMLSHYEAAAPTLKGRAPPGVASATHDGPGGGPIYYIQ